MKKFNTEKRSSWSYQLQTKPPDFGKAKLIPKWLMNFYVFKRRSKAKKIIKNSYKLNNFEKNLISIVILSCKRLNELKRLTNSLRIFLNKFENYKKYEVILVDNGSNDVLIKWAKEIKFFDKIIHHNKNLGMAAALNDAYKKVNGEYILLVEDDFYIDFEKNFLNNCIEIFNEYPEIGIIRLKNQRNWGKKYRIIGPLRKTISGIEFWTWIPSLNGRLNVWAAGSVIFRKISYLSTGEIYSSKNVPRNQKYHQGVYYEEIYGKKYNKKWLAAKIKDCYPFIQPNDNLESPGWND